MWSKGRGKLGIFKPLLGSWTCRAETEMGLLECERRFTPVLDGKFIQLEAQWRFLKSEQKDYVELAMFGIGSDKEIKFWSFTNDGKHSDGWLSDAPDISDLNLCFEADMDAGRARQTYWPGDEDGTMKWAVESRTKKGWNRFVEHVYRPLP